MTDPIEAFLVRTSDERLEELRSFIRIPTIGADPAHAGDTRAGAEFVARRLEDLGIEHVEVSATASNPIVYGDWLHAPGAPTVLVYCHYDVQPAGDLGTWTWPPFEPRIVEGRLTGRGSSDDKGQLHLHLWAARALLETSGRLPLNLRFVFEGDEESGSPTIGAWLEANRSRLSADLAVISDTGFAAGNQPALTVSLRGLIYLRIDVTGPDRDVHSGEYGGIVNNPAVALAQILAGLKDREGRITIPGFMDRVRPLSERDRTEIARLPFDVAEEAAQLGVTELFGEPGFTPLERRGARPTLDVTGIWGGSQDGGMTTIIPSEAHAKLSCRLVPEMDPEETFARVREQILRLAPPGVRVEVTLTNQGMWSEAPIDHPATAIAAQCLEEVFGAPPVYLREGGSIPVVAQFRHRLDLPVVLLGFSGPDDRVHGPDESLALDNYERGIRTVIRYWRRLADHEGWGETG